LIDHIGYEKNPKKKTKKKTKKKQKKKQKTKKEFFYLGSYEVLGHYLKKKGRRLFFRAACCLINRVATSSMPPTKSKNRATTFGIRSLVFTRVLRTKE
jgi:hypothetical protein